MQNFLFTVLALASFGLCYGAPSQQYPKQQPMDPELTAGYVEGDMVMENQLRTGLTNESLRWPDNIVYYKFGRFNGQMFDSAHVNHILRGMRIIEEASCIRFMEAHAEQTAYVNITGFSDGCYSSVGYRNTSQTYNLQIYPLDSGCFRLGTIVHEFLHTLGFYHMQSAYDRDEYVFIDEANIRNGTQHNFNKYNDSFVDHFDVSYDYGSVMHYSAYAFSDNGKMTIVPLKEEAEGIMGQRRGMSTSDIAKLNMMYRCAMLQ